ncbi:hypothetical protein M3Y95_00812900 [Aphelenchoides besseyi]|nr:hypothetical protein M3Y95_00812900 [Aphelenchoides besseyi]
MRGLDTTCTIGQINEVIQATEGIPADQQIVTTARNELKDNNGTLEEYDRDALFWPIVLDVYHESERAMLEERQEEEEQRVHAKELRRLLRQPPEIREQFKPLIAFLKNMLGITQENSDSED